MASLTIGTEVVHDGNDAAVTGGVQVYTDPNRANAKGAVVALVLGDGTVLTPGQALAAASLPVVLPAAQLTTLTPPAAIAGFALEAGHLAAIDTSTAKIPALGQALAAASVPVVLTAAQVTTLTPPANVGITGTAAISAASLPLPTGASTEATLAAQSAKLPATLGQKAMAASMAVAIASDQAAIPVTPAGNVAAGAADSGNPLKIGGKYNSSLPTLTDGQRGDLQLDANGAVRVNPGQLDYTKDTVAIGAKATGGSTPYHLRSAATNNATALKASAGTLYGWHITNNNVTTCYRVKFYNKATAPSPGSDTPVYVLTIPAASSAALPTVVQEGGLPEGIAFGTGIAFAIVAGDSDTDNTAVSTLGDINLNLKYA